MILVFFMVFVISVVCLGVWLQIRDTPSSDTSPKMVKTETSEIVLREDLMKDFVPLTIALFLVALLLVGIMVYMPIVRDMCRECCNDKVAIKVLVETKPSDAKTS